MRRWVTFRSTVTVAAVAALGQAPYALYGQITPPVPSAANGGVTVVVKTIGEEVLSGSVLGLSPTEGLTLMVRGDRRTIPRPELVRVTTSQTNTARDVRESVFKLTDGGTLVGRLVRGGEDKVGVDTHDLGEIEIDLDAIAAWFTPRAYLDSYRGVVEWLGRGRAGAVDEAQDQVLLTNGDVVDGFLLGISPKGVRFESAMGETLLSLRVVVAARFGGTKSKPLDRPYVLVSLRRSGRLTMTALDWSDSTLRGRMRFGQEVQIEARRVVALDFVGGLWEWLPSRRPISFEQTPMLALNWDFAVDRNVLGEPIVVAGETYEHGLGVHGRTRITYDLQGRYRELVTQFGMDDHSGPYANMDVQILVDGQRRFAQPGVRWGKLFGPVRVDVSRANRVELVTDFGENGDIQDRFNWVETALIR